MDIGHRFGTVRGMRLTIITLTIAAIAALTFSATASAAPSFDSDCVGTQWVIRNRGVEPFLVAAPDGEAIGMIELGAIWEPDAGRASVVIADTVIVRPSCEVLAPIRTQLPATGTSLVLAVLAFALMVTGAVAWRVASIRR